MNETVNERTIWNVRQNHPELVVRDCVAAFGLNEEQAVELRRILMFRGVNKWLLARRRFIRLKHNVKALLKEATPRTERHRLLQRINEEMQRIAKMPRWVEWPQHIHRDMDRNEAECIVRGRPL
jgi:hypothetical protein